MPTVSDMLRTRKDHVRKWGTQLLAVADIDAAVPTSFFDDTDHLPLALPSEYKQLGFITTDGVTSTRAITTEATAMVQSLEPVREDLTELKQTLMLTWGEASSAWVNGILHGHRIADLPADPNSAWSYDDGAIVDFPEYRLLWIGQDGVGPNAHYRVEFAYCAKLSAIGDRLLNRAAPEGLQTTFSLTRDPLLGKTVTRVEDGPAFHAATPPTPPEGE